MHDEELHDLYYSPNIIQMIKSRRMRLAGRVVSMGRGEGRTGFWWGNLGEREHLEGLDIYGRVVLKRIFMK
jgi:hypothetical protein